MKDLIPEAEGISLALEIAKEEGLSELGKPDYLAFLMQSCPVVLRKEDQKRYIKYEDLASFFHNARKWINEKDQRPLARQRGYKVDKLPDVLEVAESDEYLGMKGSLFPSVKEALWEIWHGDKNYLEVVLTGATGCLTGDTQLQINRRNRKTRGSANRIYDIRTAYERTANLSTRYKWAAEVPTKLLSLKDDIIGYHVSEDIVYSGKKPVYTLTTDKGKQITATAEHPFKVPRYVESADRDGFKQLQQLVPGDKVLCRAEGILSQEETVISIKSAGEQETFDVIMKPPYHNYVANDFIVHNTGKSFLMETSICYMLVRLSYMWDPQAELDLAKGTPIYLVFQAGNLEQAKNILFRPLFNRVSGSPYFQKNFPWNKDMHNELWFPNNIIVKPFSGSNDAVLGLTVVGGGITELNRMAYVTKSKKAKTAEDMLYDQAKSIYQTLIRRMVSRTMQLGKLWGKLFLDAAHEHEDDFTSQKIREAATNEHMYVYKKCQWEAIPQERFGGDKFLVEVGDRTRRSRILNTIDEAVNIDQVVRIPQEYKQWFDQDVEGALRDFGGIVVTGHRPAIPFREKIAASFEEHKKLSNGRQLFAQELVVINDYQDAFEALLDKEYLDTILLDKRVSFAAHVDPALKHDCAGLVIGHIIGWKMLQGIKVYEPRTRTYRTQSEGKAPIVMIDGLLQITAPYGEEIDLDAIQNFVIFLKEILNLEAVSADGYQSAQMIQSWRKAGFITGVVSMDTSIDPYNRVKAAYRDDRLYVPYHPTYEREIINLQYENGKYDHLPGGGHSKDIADGVAGVVYLLETHLADMSTRPSRAIRPNTTQRSRGASGRRISGRII